MDAVEAYKKVIGHADIITPNYFEMEALSGQTLKTKEDALKACDVLHQKGVGTIIMTGLAVGDKIILVASQKSGIEEGGLQQFFISFPSISRKFTGTGDFFSSLVLSWISRGDSISVACEKAVATLQVVLKRTEEMGGELKIVQSKSDTENPQVIYHAELFEDSP